MYRGHTVAVVLPAYNEAGHVGDVMTSLPGFVDRIYVVDDASTDGTWNEIRHHATELNAEADGDRRIIPIQHEVNRGAGGALKTGYLWALADEVDLTVTMDADGQMDPSYLPRLLDPLVDGRADYAKGNRLSDPDNRTPMPPVRLVGNVVLTLLTRVASGYWRISDPQNGYTAITHEALTAVSIESLYEYYGYCNDLLVRLNAEGMRVADVAIPANYGEEESHITISAYVPKVSLLLVRGFIWRIRAKYIDDGVHPVAAYYAAAVLASVTGVGLLTGGRTPAPVGVALVLLAASALLAAAGLDRSESRGLEVSVE
jgi:glycosyltransferase involved in cell wall biosynthesis